MNKTYCMPFLIAAIFCFSSSSAVVHAQSVVDFSFNRTGPNHSVLVLPIWHPVIKEMQQLDDLPSDFILGFEKDSLETGDLVGVFYTDKSGDYKCASSVTWKSNDFNMLPVWGSYPPEADNGMEMGEKLTWLAQKQDNSIYEIECSYQKPLMAIYIKDGTSAVLGMKLVKSKSLTALSPLKKQN
jgi:hypothetical protein